MKRFLTLSLMILSSFDPVVAGSVNARAYLDEHTVVPISEKHRILYEGDRWELEIDVHHGRDINLNLDGRGLLTGQPKIVALDGSRILGGVDFQGEINIEGSFYEGTGTVFFLVEDRLGGITAHRMLQGRPRYWEAGMNGHHILLVGNAEGTLTIADESIIRSSPFNFILTMDHQLGNPSLREARYRWAGDTWVTRKNATTSTSDPQGPILEPTAPTDGGDDEEVPN